MELEPGIHLISISTYDNFMRTFAPNIYLLVGKEALLIDSGNNDDERVTTVLEYLNSLAPLKLSTILLTHPHPDHVGGSRRIKEATGAKIVFNSLGASEAIKWGVTADDSIEHGDIIDDLRIDLIHHLEKVGTNREFVNRWLA